MSDHSPYVWNPQSLRYERRTAPYAESQRQQQQQGNEQYDPAASAAASTSSAPSQHQHSQYSDDWNPWAYLDNANERPYTPSQPAVGAGVALPDLPSQYDPYRLPAIHQQRQSDAYDPYDYQSSSSSGYQASAPRSGVATHQGRPPYSTATSAYPSWRSTAGAFVPSQSDLDSLTLPPLNLSLSNGSAGGATTRLAYDLSKIASSSRQSDSAYSSVRQDSRSLSEWESFLAYWSTYIRNSEETLTYQAQRGELPGFIFHSMAQPLPTFASCEDLVAGFSDSYRITVDKLKQLIRGIKSVPNLPLQGITISGTKSELIARIIDVLRSLKNTQSPAYFEVAKLIGEAQGIVYQGSAAASTLSIPQPGSAPGTSYARQYGSATYNDLAASGAGASTSASISAPTSMYPSDYASRSSQFNLVRSPGRATGVASSSYGSTTAGGASTSANNAYYQNRTYSNSPNPAYRAIAQAGSSSGSSAHAHQPQRSTASSSYGGGPLSNQIPTSLPTPLPPKSAIQGQPAIPMNFKPSPFYNIISAVSTVVALPRPGHGNERATGVAYVQLTEDQRQKLLTAREDPKAPQYQLRLYCTSSDFYHPHSTAYGTAARQALPIEFPVSSEAKMNDSAVIANLRGIKKKPGTAPPAHVSNAKVGNPSRTTSSGSTPPNNAPIGSFALKLASIRENNKVELVYMNTDKNYYMIVYFVEAYSVQQVVEKIKKERFRQKEDVLKSIHRAAEDPDIQATSSTISMKDPLTYTTLNTPIRSINCVHLQCFDAFCFLSMMESTPDWKCPVCNRAISPSSNELVHDGFFQDIKDKLPSSVDTVIVEVDGTWRTEDYKHGNSKKVLEYQERIKNGLTSSNLASHTASTGARGGSAIMSRDSSVAMGKDGTPLDVKPDIAGGSGGGGGLAAPNGGASRGQSKSKAQTVIIELDDDSTLDPYENDGEVYGVRPPRPWPPEDETPPPPPRHSALSGTSSRHGGPSAAAGAKTAGKVIDLTLSDSDDDEESGPSSSVVGLGSRAPSVRTPGGAGPPKSNMGLSIPLSGTNNNRTPGPASSATSGITTIPSSATTVHANGHNHTSTANGSGGNVAAGVKRRHDSEAIYDDLWGREEAVNGQGEGRKEDDGSNGRPAQVPRFA